MAVKRVNTLGCHPMILLKKMEMAGGLVVLKEEKFVSDSDGLDRPCRLTAQVNDFYIEARDAFFEAERDRGDFPELWKNEWGNRPSNISLLRGKLEADETDKNRAKADGSTNTSYFIHLPCGIAWEEVAPSFLFAFPLVSPSTNGYAMFAYRTGKPGSSSAPVYWQYSRLSPSTVLTSENLPAARMRMAFNETTTSYSTFTTMKLEKIDETGYSSFPFVILCSEPGVPWPTYADRDTEPASYVPGILPSAPSSSSCPPLPIIFSATRIRVSPTIDEDNELVAPSAWAHCPIFTNISRVDDGLVFSTGGGENAGILAVLKVDTTKGNNFNSGKCLAIYENYPKAFTPDALYLREKMTVYGDPKGTSNSKNMAAYIAVPPVSYDSIVGGPVASEVFAFDSEEVRGIVNGVLGVPESINVGTMGWLDGKQYQVILPGRMIQVG